MRSISDLGYPCGALCSGSTDCIYTRSSDHLKIKKDLEVRITSPGKEAFVVLKYELLFSASEIIKLYFITERNERTEVFLSRYGLKTACVQFPYRVGSR